VQYQIINKNAYYRKGSDKILLEPAGGKLYVKCWTGSTWTTDTSFGEPGNTNNEFRYIVEEGKLKIQQIKDGGSWGGIEGVDFVTIQEFNKT